jgi:hypothetical protein
VTGLLILPNIAPNGEKRFKWMTKTLGGALTRSCLLAQTRLLHFSHFHSFPADNFSGLVKARMLSRTVAMPELISKDKSKKWLNV